MRRRPHEHDREQGQRRERDVPGRCRPADERGHRAGRPADDDVLRRRALQPARVDEDVEQVAGEREQGRRHVDRHAEQHERRGRERQTELERLRRAIRARRPPGGGRCAPIVRSMSRSMQVVERARPATGERESDHRRGDPAGRGQPARADHHPAAPVRRSSDMIARLGEHRRSRARPRARRALAERRRGRHERGGERRRGDRDVQGDRPRRPAGQTTPPRPRRSRPGTARRRSAPRAAGAGAPRRSAHGDGDERRQRGGGQHAVGQVEVQLPRPHDERGARAQPRSR